MHASIEAHATAARIGPNAIIRVAEALREGEDAAACETVFAAAGLSRYITALPAAMVDEDEVARLQAALIAVLGFDTAMRMAGRAGELTGDYLLAHRIPMLAQRLLRLLPRRMAAALLVKAIARHAWTFAGSGLFSFGFTPVLTLRLEAAPVARLVRSDAPACAYYAATFARVFAAMLGDTVRVVETRCEAQGAPACVFVVTW